MKKKSCELCSDAATMYCESDSASLCLRCDEKVHGANFLVAKHERSLLCSVCQSVTSWKASGPRVGRAVSVCDGCDRNGIGGKVDLQVDDEAAAAAAAAVGEEEVESRDRSDGDEEPETSSDEEDEDEDDVEEDEDEENQVVPWSSGEGLSSSSICGGERSRELKRRRDISDLDSDEEIEDEGGSSSADWDRSRGASRLIGI